MGPTGRAVAMRHTGFATRALAPPDPCIPKGLNTLQLAGAS